MKKLDDIIAELRILEKEKLQMKQLNLYKNMVENEIKEKEFFTAKPLGSDKDMYPFVITLHPALNVKHWIPFHNHNFFELMYVYHGNCENECSGITMQLQEHDLLLLNPDSLHRMRIFEESDVIFNFLISKEVFQQTILALMSDDIISHFIANYFYQIHKSVEFVLVNKSEDSPLYQVLNRIIAEYFNKLPGFERILEMGLVEIFSYMSRIVSNQFTPSNSFPSSPFLSSILLYIYKNYTTVTLKEVAYTFGYNEKYISRTIKKNLNTRFSDLIKEVRLNHATQYLIKTTMSIQQISQMIGYYNLSYFYTIFRKKYKMSPNEYRQKYQQSIPVSSV